MYAYLELLSRIAPFIIVKQHPSILALCHGSVRSGRGKNAICLKRILSP